MEESAIDRRLDKIEDKIDKLSESMVLLARAEEKLINMEADRKMLWDKLISMQHDIDEIKNVQTETITKQANSTKLQWALISILGSALTVKLFELV